MPRKIVLFGEDKAHQAVISALIQEVANEYGLATDVHLRWLSATGGRTKVVTALRGFLGSLRRRDQWLPDLIVVATDANCMGLNERVKEFQGLDAPVPMVLAIPDPHVERWLLLDGAAFRAVFGRGCSAPDRKCARNRYKQKLREEIHKTGRPFFLDGTEFARDVVVEMDLDRVAGKDGSFARFVGELRSVFAYWRSSS